LITAKVIYIPGLDSPAFKKGEKNKKEKRIFDSKIRQKGHPKEKRLGENT